ncbi:hypothetical protein DYB30_005112 [Aphanomyces astaci]|uniref:Uncharacterized protein n=1 Tax=Aphanomyces astaci TaxID=112090 RepID=A0A397D768_APHAT|nr:hypothetical protein DYB30_005112 [Aphanomyces astaci]
MSPHSTSAPLYNGPPLDDHNRTFLEWKPLFISQADGHEFTQFYMNKAYVPSDLERSILSILDDDVQVDKLKHPELYHVDPDLSEDGLAARHKVIADHVQSVKSATLKSETAKSLSRLRALALTFLNSSMVDSLRKLFSNIACPFTLYESIVSRFENNPLTSDPAVLNAQSQKVKYHDGDCLDTLLADVKSIASQYRTAMIPSSLEITAAEYDAFLWANHYMVKLSEFWPQIIRVIPNATVFRKKCSKNTARSPHDVCRLAKSAMIILVVTTTTVTTAMTAVAAVQAPLVDVVVAPRRSAILLAVVAATVAEMTAIALGVMKAIEAVAAEAFHRHHSVVVHVVLKLRSTPIVIPTVLMLRHRLPSRSVSLRPTPVIVSIPQVLCIVAAVTLFRPLISVLPLCPLPPWYLSIVLVICPVVTMLIVVLLLPVVTTLQLAPATGRPIPCYMVELAMWLLLLHLPALVIVWTEMTITDPRSVCAGLHHRRIPSVTPAPQIPFWTKLYLPPLVRI